MKSVLNFLLSLKTLTVLFLVFIVVLAVGSLMLPANLAFFSGIDDTPLFKWLSDAGNLRATWWIYGMILMLVFLAISTILCTAEALIKKISWRNFTLKLTPQVIHSGVLFVMLGHLLTASMGFKADVLIKKGEQKALSENISVYLEDVNVQTDVNGYTTGWEVRLWLFKDGNKIKEDVLMPVNPVYFGQFGLYSRSVEAGPDVSALIRVCRDPGALFSLIGGLLLFAGGLGFISVRFRN